MDGDVKRVKRSTQQKMMYLNRKKSRKMCHIKHGHQSSLKATLLFLHWIAFLFAYLKMLRKEEELLSSKTTKKNNLMYTCNMCHHFSFKLHDNVTLIHVLPRVLKKGCAISTTFFFDLRKIRFTTFTFNSFLMSWTNVQLLLHQSWISKSW